MKRDNAKDMHIELPARPSAGSTSNGRAHQRQSRAPAQTATAASAAVNGKAGAGQDAPQQASKSSAVVAGGTREGARKRRPSLLPAFLGWSRGGNNSSSKAESAAATKTSSSSPPSSSASGSGSGSSSSLRTNPSASRLLASLASLTTDPTLRFYTYANADYGPGDKLDPLLLAEYDEPEIIQAFADALTGEDLGLNVEAHDVGTADELEQDTEGGDEGDGEAGGEGETKLLSASSSKPSSPAPTAEAKGFAASLRSKLFGSGKQAKGSSGGSGTQRRRPSSAPLPKDLFLSAASDFAPIRERRSPVPTSVSRRGRVGGGAMDDSEEDPMAASTSRPSGKSKTSSGGGAGGPVSEAGAAAASAASAAAAVAAAATTTQSYKLRGADTGTREGLVYSLIRWPLLLIIFLTIGLEFAAYVLTRQAVNLVELAVGWRGQKGELRKELRRAESWEDWRFWPSRWTATSATTAGRRRTPAASTTGSSSARSARA